MVSILDNVHYMLTKGININRQDHITDKSIERNTTCFGIQNKYTFFRLSAHNALQAFIVTVFKRADMEMFSKTSMYTTSYYLFFIH